MGTLSDQTADVAGRCAAVRTLSAARSITRHYDDVMKPTGLTITQFTLLVTISRIKPNSISEIAETLTIDRTTVTRNLSVLERLGLISRGQESHARRRAVSLTRKGANSLTRAYKYWSKAQEEVEQAFSKAEFSKAMASLRTLREVKVGQ